MDADDDLLSVRVVLQPGADTDPEEHERLTLRLRRELAALDVESAVLDTSGPAPEDSKAGSAVDIGAIVVALSASGGVFAGLVGALREWLGRTSEPRRITLTVDGDTIELDHATSAERAELIDAFVHRHSRE
jgi:Effector Associated Constant Component 1